MGTHVWVKSVFEALQPLSPSLSSSHASLQAPVPIRPPWMIHAFNYVEIKMEEFHFISPSTLAQDSKASLSEGGGWGSRPSSSFTQACPSQLTPKILSQSPKLTPCSPSATHAHTHSINQHCPRWEASWPSQQKATQSQCAAMLPHTNQQYQRQCSEPDAKWINQSMHTDISYH